MCTWVRVASCLFFFHFPSFLLTCVPIFELFCCIQSYQNLEGGHQNLNCGFVFVFFFYELPLQNLVFWFYICLGSHFYREFAFILIFLFPFKSSLELQSSLGSPLLSIVCIKCCICYEEYEVHFKFFVIPLSQLLPIFFFFFISLERCKIP